LDRVFAQTRQLFNAEGAEFLPRRRGDDNPAHDFPPLNSKSEFEFETAFSRAPDVLRGVINAEERGDDNPAHDFPPLNSKSEFEFEKAFSRAPDALRDSPLQISASPREKLRVSA
jgi:hypothetical protein